VVRLLEAEDDDEGLFILVCNWRMMSVIMVIN
jgi:hypothetical protein